MLKTILLAFGGIISGGLACAQSIGPSAVNAAGGSATIGGNTYEYSIGNITLSQTYSSATLIVTDGVLQPNFSTSGIGQQSISAAQLSVFPNPVTSSLYLQPAFLKGGRLLYVLTDAAGKTVTTHTTQLRNGNERQEVVMKHLAAGQYTLTVEWQEGNKTALNSYKIQKIQ